MFESSGLKPFFAPIVERSKATEDISEIPQEHCSSDDEDMSCRKREQSEDDSEPPPPVKQPDFDL
jgi:hypothetical protein